MQAGYLPSTSVKAAREILAADRGVGLAIAALRRCCWPSCDAAEEGGGHSEL